MVRVNNFYYADQNVDEVKLKVAVLNRVNAFAYNNAHSINTR